MATGVWRKLPIMAAALSVILSFVALGVDTTGATRQQYESVVAFENTALAAEASARIKDAITARKQALDIATSINRPSLVAVLFNRLGRAFEEDDQVQEAVFAYEAGFRALVRDPHLNLRDVLGSLSSVRKGFDPGERSAPVDTYSATTDRELTSEETDPALAVSLLINIGNVYLRQPQDGPALNAYRQALARPEIERVPKLKAYALANSGEILRRGGDTAAAQRALNEALRLLERHAEPLEKRRALALLAGIERDNGAIARARRLYADALALYEQTNDGRGEGRAYAGLGRLQLDAGEVKNATKAFERALALGKKANDQESLWSVYWGLGQSFKRAGKLDAAANALDQSLQYIGLRQRDLRTDEGKVAFLETTRDVFDQLIDVHLERGRRDVSKYQDALAVAEDSRGRALSDMMQGWGGGARPSEEALGLASCLPGRSRGTDVREATQDDVALAVRQQSPGTPMGPMPNAAAVPRFAVPPNAGVFPNAAALPPTGASPDEINITPQGPNSSGVAAPVETQRARPRSQRPPLARLVFHVMSNRTAVFVVSTAGVVTGYATRLGRVELEREVAQLRAALNVDNAARGVVRGQGATPPHPPDEQAARPLLRNLFATLIAPVAHALPRTGELLAIEPHGALWLVPFAALLDEDNRWLAERVALLYSPSAALLDEMRAGDPYTKRTEARALIVGNPISTAVAATDDDRFRIGFNPLPGADREADTIARFFRDDTHMLLRGDRADLATVVREAANYSILHLATHGIARAEDPLESFVLLARSTCGDQLSARRVLSLPLQADLVTLSACQTGLGRVAGDGVIGLSRAFFIAGARSVLVSQWSIDDEATIKLMQSFYRQYLQNDMDKAHALQQAMRELRADPRYAHPRYWAPFALLGAEF